MTDCWLEGLDGSQRRVTAEGLLLGRSAECAFRILDTRISDRHADVSLRQDGAFLTPRGPVPTLLNGRPVRTPRQLTDGDWIGLAPGVLFRVVEHARPSAKWVVQVDDSTHTLSEAGTTALPLSLGALAVEDDGRLLLSFTETAHLNSVGLAADLRPWVLCVGDEVVLADGVRITVSDGPMPTTPPQPWSLPPLRCTPPLGADRPAPNLLRMAWVDGAITVPVRDDALLQALLAAGGPVPAPEAALLRLQEDLIRGGVDGFVVLQSIGAEAHLQHSGKPITGASTPASATEPAWWLHLCNGSRIWVDSGGVLIGRNLDCDIRIRAPYIHRYHALLRVNAGAVELVPLGRNPSYVSGHIASTTTRVTEGAWVAADPGRRMILGRADRPVRRRPPLHIQLDGHAHTLQTQTSTIGSGSTDTRHAHSWPAGAVRLHRLETSVFVESRLPATLDGQPLPPDRVRRIHPGQSLTLAGHRLTLTAFALQPARTPRMVMLQPIGKAGRLLFWFEDRTQLRVSLLQQHYQLMQILLESYVGSRLRGATRTRSPFSLTGPELPRGAARHRDLRMELSGTRRLSLVAFRDLLEAVKSALVRAGIDGSAMLQTEEEWSRLQLGETCNVTLFNS